MTQIYDQLTQLNIPFQIHTHPAVFTAAEAAWYYADIPGAHVKNLFLRNRKGDRHYLVVVLDNKTVDLKQLALQLGEKQLSFASAERLQTYLKVTPGSVSALGLVFDTTRAVTVLCDKEIQDYTYINAHPNNNTTTLTLTLPNFVRYIEQTGHTVQFITI